jgi:hypothetical protein
MGTVRSSCMTPIVVRQINMVISPVGPETKNDCAGENQQKFTPMTYQDSQKNIGYRPKTKNGCADEGQQQFTKQTAQSVGSQESHLVVRCEHGSRGVSTVRSRYQTMTMEDIGDCEDLVCVCVRVCVRGRGRVCVCVCVCVWRKVKMLSLFVVMCNKHSIYLVFNPNLHVWSVTHDSALKY